MDHIKWWLSFEWNTHFQKNHKHVCSFPSVGWVHYKYNLAGLRDICAKERQNKTNRNYLSSISTKCFNEGLIS